MHPPRAERSRINLLAASFGAASLVVQTEFLRGVLVSASGGALAVGAALGVWLCWIAAGALAGGSLAGSRRAGESLLAAFSALALPAGLFVIFYLAVIRQIAHIPAGELIPFSTLCYHAAVACGPFAFLVGLSFPVFAGLSARDRIIPASPPAFFIGHVWASEAAGAFIAGTFFTFVLAGRTGPVVNTAVFSGLPILTCAIVRISRNKVSTSLSVLSFISLAVLFFFLPSIGSSFSRLYWKGLGSPGEFLSSLWTRYSNVSFVRLADQTILYENGEPQASFPDPYNDAARVALYLSQQPALQRILVVGPAAEGLAQAFLSAGVHEVVAVYPDQQLERQLLSYLPAGMKAGLSAGGYRYIPDDARRYLSRPRPAVAGCGPAGWDLVLLNLDGPSQMNSSRFFTPGFFRLARRAFGPAGGVLALRLPAGANVMLPAQLDQAAAVWASLKTTFRYLSLALSSTHCFIFATDRDSLVSDDLALLMQRVQPYENRVPRLSRYILPVYFDSTRSAPFRDALEAASGRLKARHTDTTPVAWFHQLRLWARLARQARNEKTGPGMLEKALELAGKTSAARLVLWPALFLTVILAALWYGASARGEPDLALARAAAVSIGVTGFVSMGATVALIYLCQLVFGSLFYQVAMISATFMLALAAGSWWAAPRARAANLQALSCLAFLISVVVILPGVGLYLLEPLYGLEGVWGKVLANLVFYLSVACEGLFCGAFFPWAAAARGLVQGPGETGVTAAVLDCADHLGAAAGAFLVGVIAVPALGIGVVCAGLALCMICVALFWYAVSKTVDRNG